MIIIKNYKDVIFQFNVTDDTYLHGGRIEFMDFIKTIIPNASLNYRNLMIHLDNKLIYYNTFTFLHHKDDNILKCDKYSLYTNYNEFKSSINFQKHLHKN